jgi:hypothetical protein
VLRFAVAVAVVVALELIFVAFDAVSVAVFVTTSFPIGISVFTTTSNRATSVVSPDGKGVVLEIIILLGDVPFDMAVPLSAVVISVTYPGSVSIMLTDLAESVPVSPYFMR